MKLYKEASLMMLPTSVKDGKLYSIFPQPKVISGELVTNGDFSDGENGWTLGTGWSISGGYATHTGSTGNLTSDDSLTNGKKYKVSFKIISISDGVCNIYDTSSGTTYASFDSVGVKSATITKDISGSLAIRSSSTNAVIDNISVVEVDQVPADFDFSRGADRATRVNEQGLVRPVEIVGSELVQNGSFDTTLGSELVQNGDFEEIGDELVTNGGFDTDSDWTKVNATISGGEAIVNVVGGAFSYISQNISYTSSRVYRVEIQVQGTSGYNIRFQDNASNLGDFFEIITLDGTKQSFSYYFTANANSDTIQISRHSSSGDYSFSIDNISVKEVGQNWTFGDGWSIEDGVASHTGSTTGNLITSASTTINKLYKVQFEILSISDGVCNIYDISGTTYASFSTTGLKSAYITKDSSSALALRSNSSNVTIDNISVQEVQGLDDWTLSDADFVGDNGVRISSDGSSGSYVQQLNILEIGKVYKLNFDVTEANVVGNLRVGFTSALSMNNLNVGSYEFYFTSTGISFEIVRNGAVDVVLDNISVVEVTEATDLPRLDWSGDCPVLLLEPQRTNLVTYSNFKSGEWVGFADATLENNYGISPDGTRNSTTINSFGGSNDFVYDNTPISNGVEYTTSFFVKNINATRTEFWAVDTTEGGRLDWNGSEITNAVKCTFEDFGNGWYRVQSTQTSNVTSYITRIYPDRNATGSVEVYGYQVEQGSYATSYIPTRGQAATRAKDIASSLDFSGFTTGEDFTMFVELADNEELVRDDSSNNIRLSDAGGSNLGSIRIYKSDSNATRHRVVFQDNTGDFSPPSVLLDSTNPKVAIKRTFATGEFKVFVDGVLRSTGTNTDYLAFEDILLEGGGSPINVKELTLFDKALSDNECINLTTL